MTLLQPSSIPQSIVASPKGRTTKEKVRNTLTDELIFAICAPIGSLREPVISRIKSILQEFNYDVQIIKLSTYIEQFYLIDEEEKPGETAKYTFLMNKIRGGDELRKEFGPSILIELAIKDIHDTRHEIEPGKIEFTKTEELKSRRKCFIIDSLKNKEELEVLRDIYKDLFYLFSIFSPMTERVNNLSEKGLSKDEARRLIETDNFENNEHGQNVKDTFVEADFFVRVSQDNLSKLNDKMNRYLNIIFESEIVTPYPHEIAMYEAQSAAGNSSCLSRQVGAAITTELGEVISRGWNDVPKYGGNLYQEGDEIDHRCKIAGYCRNDKTKEIVADDILKNILDDDYLIENVFGGKHFEIESAEYKLIKRIIRKNTRIKDLIEFSRSVHAEMHALIIGAQLSGARMIGGKLFSTTYPCHNCARHIIVAGIKEIYYIEPYSKSLSLALHSDALTENESEDNKVKILVYDGVAPRKYLEFFLMNRPRKDEDGKITMEFKEHFNPKNRLSLQALPTLEQQAIHSLYEQGLLSDE